MRNNPLFRLLDRIPGLRRSGTASRWDLFRAMMLHPFLSHRASLYDTLFPPRRRPQ